MAEKWVDVPRRHTAAPARVPHTRTRTPKPAASGNASPRHSKAQEALFEGWVLKQTPVQLVFNDGTEITGYIQVYDTYALAMADLDGRDFLVYKGAIRMIYPLAEDAGNHNTPD